MSASQYEQIWEAEYGEPERLFDELAPLADAMSQDSWTTAVIYVNNNPYRLELFVGIGVDPEHAQAETDIRSLELALRCAGARPRSDITFTDLSSAAAKRRFNIVSFTDSRSLNTALTAGRWASRSKLVASGIDMGPSGHRARVFLSHHGERQSEVIRLRDRLAARDLPTWIDVSDIEYGQNLAEAIEQGIAASTAVVLWVSPRFLQSRWCRFEMRSFISDFAATDRVKLLAVLDPEVNPLDVPRTLTRLRYLQLAEGQGAEHVDAEFGPLLQRMMGR